MANLNPNNHNKDIHIPTLLNNSFKANLGPDGRSLFRSPEAFALAIDLAKKKNRKAYQKATKNVLMSRKTNIDSLRHFIFTRYKKTFKESTFRYASAAAIHNIAANIYFVFVGLVIFEWCIRDGVGISTEMFNILNPTVLWISLWLGSISFVRMFKARKATKIQGAYYNLLRFSYEECNKLTDMHKILFLLKDGKYPDKI